MTALDRSLRLAFAAQTPLFVRVCRDGFLIGDEPVNEIVGRLRSARLLRKMFRDGVLFCDSPDGITARNGTRCADCAHPRCRPALRLSLARDSALYVLDLATTSARNFFDLEDHAQACGVNVEDWTLRATVRPRDTWGEVHFERVS
jgi:hypothetical protein